METLRDTLREFARARDWEKFHSPKNLSMALVKEAAEIVEHFQWKRDAEVLTDAEAVEVGREIGDVLIYLVMLSDALGLDPVAEARAKIRLNARKYPERTMR